MEMIKIVKVPPGQAPEWAREGWIGVTIPVQSVSESRMQTMGVLGGSPSPASRSGYVVNIADALSALESQHPKAAPWWKKWSHKPIGQRSSNFVFPKDVCQLTTT